MTFDFSFDAAMDKDASYDGGNYKFGRLLRITGNKLSVGYEVCERMGFPEYVRLAADVEKLAIHIESCDADAAYARKLTNPLKSGRRIARNITIKLLSQKLPRGNYRPLPSDPQTFVHESIYREVIAA